MPSAANPQHPPSIANHRAKCCLLLSAKQLIALGLGVALIYETGPVKSRSKPELIGLKLFFIVTLERIVDLLNTVGWWFMFALNLRRGTLGALYLVRLAGSARDELTLPPRSVASRRTPPLLPVAAR